MQNAPSKKYPPQSSQLFFPKTVNPTLTTPTTNTQKTSMDIVIMYLDFMCSDIITFM